MLDELQVQKIMDLLDQFPSVMKLAKQFKKKHGRTNYEALEPFLTATDNAGGHAHFKADGFMDFVVENLERSETFLGEPMQVYSIAHNSVQNGDLMADPDMEIGVINDGEHMRVIPMTFQNDFMGIYQTVFNYDRTAFSRQLLTALDEFLYLWLENIKDQGFYDDIPNVKPELEEEENEF